VELAARPVTGQRVRGGCACGARGRAPSWTCGWSARRAPTSGRWPGTWAPGSASAGTSPRCAAPGSGPFGLDTARTLDELAEHPELTHSLETAVAAAFRVRVADAEEAAALSFGRPLTAVGIAGVYAVTDSTGRALHWSARWTTGRNRCSCWPRPTGPRRLRRLAGVLRWRGLDDVPTGWGRSRGHRRGVRRGAPRPSEADRSRGWRWPPPATCPLSWSPSTRIRPR